MNQYLYIIIICVITLSCAQEPNDEKHIEDVDSTPIDSVEINRINLVKKGMIGEYSQDFNVFDDKCSKYYESLLKEINIWPENAKIVDFMEFTPSKVLNETSDNLSQGVFVYSFYETIEDSIDSNYFAQASFFNNQRQVLIPVHLKDSGYVELDTIFEIYLPLKNIEIECLSLKLDSSKRDPFTPFGMWERVDRNGERIRK